MSKYFKQLLVLALALGHSHTSFCMPEMMMEHPEAREARHSNEHERLSDKHESERRETQQRHLEESQKMKDFQDELHKAKNNKEERRNIKSRIEKEFPNIELPQDLRSSGNISNLTRDLNQSHGAENSDLNIRHNVENNKLAVKHEFEQRQADAAQSALEDSFSQSFGKDDLFTDDASSAARESVAKDDMAKAAREAAEKADQRRKSIERANTPEAVTRRQEKAQARREIEAQPEKFLEESTQMMKQIEQTEANDIRTAEQNQAIDTMRESLEQAEKSLEESKNSVGAKAKNALNKFSDMMTQLWEKLKGLLAQDGASLAIKEMANRPTEKQAYKDLGLSEGVPRTKVEEAYKELVMQEQGNPSELERLRATRDAILEPDNFDMKGELKEHLRKMRDNTFGKPDPYNKPAQMEDLANTFLKTLRGRGEDRLTPETTHQLREMVKTLNEHLPPDQAIKIDFSKDVDAGGHIQGNLHDVTFKVGKRERKPIADAEQKLGIDLSNPDVTSQDIINRFDRKEDAIKNSNMAESEKDAAIKSLEADKATLIQAKEKGLTRDPGGYHDTMQTQRDQLARAEDTFGMTADELRNPEDVEKAYERAKKLVQDDLRSGEITNSEYSSKMNTLKEGREALLRAEKGRNTPDTSIKTKVNNAVNKASDFLKDFVKKAKPKARELVRRAKRAIDDFKFNSRVKDAYNTLDLPLATTNEAKLDTAYNKKRTKIERKYADKPELAENEKSEMNKLDDAYNDAKRGIKNKQIEVQKMQGKATRNDRAETSKASEDIDALDGLSNMFKEEQDVPQSVKEDILMIKDSMEQEQNSALVEVKPMSHEEAKGQLAEIKEQSAKLDEEFEMIDTPSAWERFKAMIEKLIADLKIYIERLRKSKDIPASERSNMEQEAQEEQAKAENMQEEADKKAPEEAKPEPTPQEAGIERAEKELAGKSPAEILGLPEDASRGQITRAYRDEALKFHPDKHMTESPENQAYNERMFKAVQNSFEKLRG